MDYKATIQYLFPTAIYNTDYRLYFPVGSQVPQILAWNTAKLGAQPSIDVLQQAWNSVLVQQAQTVQIALIAAASAAAQTTGFTSSALGSAYSYPSGLQDQANLTACIVASLMPGNASTWTVEFWCMSAAGVSNFVPHTAAQIQQVGKDALAAIMVQKSKQYALSLQIQAATTIAAVQAVVWG
ncbi:MAG: DUF4376 domain-containing protein [Proteobacteria bacterium]|nr:DUF4376 domain-containing protein [Pseudomonadota bacterium]